ncbi:transmembrane protein, putative (macronuclear) [Tetrahymena thermophila SB210]|uniref:Transmembrane protein, putative n=1 Tax=Tetrahymena thermophila (strain SB210) TaxID=312017 RepID=Q22P90_TETTS|nr:transmembrane protein, putative [Tetrahymena thermophila SB210]EAR87219.2 transmembrane protein, putative [Tetrahymena thermophila SB210]|eukprot:XP_001007464.2 transmembrane protein, putative [Tetrahymena thermophila SB210]
MFYSLFNPPSLLIESNSEDNIIYCTQDKMKFQNIFNLIIKNIFLIIIDPIYINTSNQIDILQMYNINLEVQKQFLIQYIDNVYLQNIKLRADENNQSQNQIIIMNCNQVFIENILIENISGISFAFNLQNNQQIIINNVQIFNSSFSDVFLINNTTSILISNIKIKQASQISLFQITLVNNVTLSNILINNVINSQILNIQGSIYSSVQNIFIDYSSQLQLFTIKSFQIDEMQQLSNELYLKNIKISQSNDIQSYLQVRFSFIENLQIGNILVKNSLFSITASIVSIKKLNLENIQVEIDDEDLTLFLVNDFMDIIVNQIYSFNNEVSILTISQQQDQGLAKMYSCKFLNSNIKKSISLIQFIDLGNLDIKDIEVENIEVKSNQYSSIIILKQCNLTSISNSTFKNNINQNGIGGSIYAIDNSNIQINSCIFIQNQCLKQNGGALFISNKLNICQLTITSSKFISNYAVFSTGGAINLINSNLIMKETLIQQNEAAIGGGIYYEQIIPDIIFDFQNKNENNNQINKNYAKFYGKNIGSTLRKILLDQKYITISNHSSMYFDKQQLFIKQFKSGNYIQFNKIQLHDEEDNPLTNAYVSQEQFINYSSNVQTIIQQTSIQIQCNQSIKQIQCNGELSSKQFVNGGFKLNIQVMQEPLAKMVMQLQSNVFPQLLDSKGKIYLSQQALQININIDFDTCSVGEIQKQQGDSIICEQCPEGKYSLNLQDQSCQQCPESAIQCQNSIIKLKNGYWRLNDLSDEIIYCSFNPDSCQPESQLSKFNCVQGNIGPLCQSCDSYGEVWGNKYSQVLSPGKCYKCDENFQMIIIYNLLIFLFVASYVFTILKKVLVKLQVKLSAFFLNKADILFLGSTIYQSDKPQIISKILTDHLQIISLICQFQFNLPNFYSFPFQVSGSSMSITSKSLNCFFSNHPEMQPMWFFQSISSFMLPIFIFFTYLTIGLIIYKRKRKNNIIVNHIKTTAIFLYFYFFPMVIIHLSRSLNCIQIGKYKYLDLDLNVKCLDAQKHQPYILYFSIPLLVLWAILIPMFLFLKVRKGKKQKWSIFQEIKYSFIFAGYQERFYFWEFGKLVFKSILIITSILLQQSEFLQVCSLNVLFLIQSYIIFRSKPYINQYFNNLLQKQSLISTISLNLSSIQSNYFSQDQYGQNIVFTLILIILNLSFVMQLILGIIQITISNEKANRNFIQEAIYKIKMKYPWLFENISIQSSNRIKSLIKLKSVKNKIKNLLTYFKNHNFYHQESFQTHFNLQTPQAQNSERQQSNRFVLLKSNQLSQNDSIFKKKNSFKNMRDKWAYYTRETKQSPLNQNKINKQHTNYFDTQENDKILMNSVRSSNNQMFSDLADKSL